MSRSKRRPYDHVVSFNPSKQRASRNSSRRLIRRKSKRNVKDLMENPDIDIPYIGMSFKDGYDEWEFPSDGHQHYIKERKEFPDNPRWTEEGWEQLRNYRKKVMRK